MTTSARAWGDPLLVLCIALAALAAFRFGDRPTWGRSAVLGVAFGLGAAAKLSPILMSAALGLFGVALAPAGGRGPMGRDAALREFGRKLAAVPVFAFATFLALYPYLWRNPILHTFRMFEFRTESFRLQAIDSPAKVTNRGDAFRRIGVELGDRFSTSGELIEWLGIEGVSSLRYLDLILAVAGLLFLTAIVIRDGVLSPRSLTVAVVGGHALLVVLTIEVEFARYLLPVVLLVAKAAGTTLGVVQEACMRPWSRRRVRSPSPQLVRSDTTA